MTPRFAIVTPWFGEDQVGGAEKQAREIARRLAERGYEVDVLTTRCRSFLDDWGQNHLPRKSYRDGRVTVRRFAVDSRFAGRFRAMTDKLWQLDVTCFNPGQSPLTKEEESFFLSSNINSQSLLNFLEKNEHRYHKIIFIPYLYGPILNGLPLVQKKAVLQPCLHDEAYAYLRCVQSVFYDAGHLLFNSRGELQIALRLYGPGIWNKSAVVGEGIEDVFEAGGDSRAPRPAFTKKKYFLCLGRRDTTKNTPFLVDAFRRYRRESGTRTALMLAGPGNRTFSAPNNGIYDLELVSTEEKRWLLENAFALLQPSLNESFSRVLMEAWANCKPVVVHGDCEATALAVKECNGGLLACTEEEWVAALRRLDGMPEAERHRIGSRGYDFARETADWDRVMDRYEAVLCEGRLNGRQRRQFVATDNSGRAIHQVLPNMSYGDAISDSALTLRNFLRNRGFTSDIFVQYLDERMANEAHVFRVDALTDNDGVIYHHSIGSELTNYVVSHRGPKVLIYHNITPPQFFEPFDADFSKLLDDGMRELKNIAPAFDQAWGDSAFNVTDLEMLGFAASEHLPLTVDPRKWDELPDETTIHALSQDDAYNVLFVGRLSPNKCQTDLVAMMANLVRLNPQVRLCIVGDGDADSPYVRHLKNRIADLRLDDHVLITGQVTQSALQSFYRTADVYVSMSEHEGFGVPLIESMWFDVPVVAYKSSAIAETLGEAGLMFTSKNNLAQVAALVNVVLTDDNIRRCMISAQRRNRERFTAKRLEPAYDKLLMGAFG